MQNSDQISLGFETPETDTRPNTFRAADSYRIAEVRTVTVQETALPAALRECNKPELAARFFAEVVQRASWFDADKECCVVLLLNRKNKLIGWNLVSLGTLTASMLHPREVLRAALVAGASGFIVMHNHPSGDPAPSSADAHVTRMIREAAKAVDVQFLDHVISGRASEDPAGVGHFSFRTAGML